MTLNAFCLKYLIVFAQADEDGVVDYEMMVSLIPERYYERVSKMIFGCKHLGVYVFDVFEIILNQIIL